MGDGLIDDLNIYLDKVKKTIDDLDRNDVKMVIDVLLETRERGGKVFIFGNGGSASTASHCTCDFNKGVSLNLNRKFNFVCLSDNTATMMAIANDIGYDKIFSTQLKGVLSDDDIVFAISGSGNSKNILDAVKYAKDVGTKIVSLTGYDGGELLKLSDYPIHVNIDDMQVAEDAHMMICHLLASTIAKRLGHPMC